MHFFAHVYVITPLIPAPERNARGDKTSPLLGQRHKTPLWWQPRVCLCLKGNGGGGSGLNLRWPQRGIAESKWFRQDPHTLKTNQAGKQPNSLGIVQWAQWESTFIFFDFGSSGFDDPDTRGEGGGSWSTPSYPLVDLLVISYAPFEFRSRSTLQLVPKPKNFCSFAAHGHPFFVPLSHRRICLQIQVWIHLSLCEFWHPDLDLHKSKCKCGSFSLNVWINWKRQIDLRWFHHKIPAIVIGAICRYLPAQLRRSVSHVWEMKGRGGGSTRCLGNYFQSLGSH